MNGNEHIHNAVDAERQYQRKKWPNHQRQDLGRWLAVMRSELAEAESAIVAGNDADCLREILQVVATGFAAIEAHGLNERNT